MRPTPEFRAHHDVEDPRVDEVSFRQAWRVHARLDQLLADKRINRDVWQAAIARHCRRHPHTVRDWTVLALFALARAWAGATRRPRPSSFPRQPEKLDRAVASS